MMKNEIEFKPQQKEILDLWGKNLIVSASAGSGKTTVMISKIASLILSRRASVDSILVLTYTQSAASEMKQKLINELKKHVNENEFLQEEIENIEQADISTIHSFCQRLIKKNFYLIKNLSPNFSILSSQQKSILKVKAIKNVLEKFKNENQSDYLNLIKIYDRNHSDDKITEIVFAIDDFLDSYLDKEEYRNRIAFHLYDNPDIAYNILNEKLCSQITSIKNEFYSYYNKANELELQVCKELSADVLNSLEQLTPQNDFLKNISLISVMKFARKKDEPENPELLGNILSARDNLKDFRKKILQKNYTENLQQSFSINREIVQKFISLQKEYEKQYTLLKKQNNALDFSDLERYAIFLTEQNNIKEMLKEKFKQIFIDEFQDANQVQEKLISNIARTDNRFMVGDVKQSIYGFRRSNPQIFLDIEKKYQNEENSQSKTLNLNFRSDENILEFVNSIFSVIMTEEISQIDYKNKAMFQPFKILPKTNLPRVAINIAYVEKKEKAFSGNKIFSILSEESDADEEITSAEKEASLVANDIYKLKQHYLFENDEKRDIKYGDMTILVRKRGKYFDRFCSALTSYGIPIYANSSKSIFEQEDVLKLLNLLKLTQNFYDDFSLVSTMLSFIGNFTYQELADIKLQYQSEKYFYNCVINYGENQTDDLSKKINAFILLIKSFANDCQIKGVYLSLNSLLDKTEFKTKTFAFNEGFSRVETINKFVDIFKDENFNFNVQAFLEYADSKNNDIKMPSYTAGEMDCVNITTIHASKGLEYPIVFLVQTGADFTRSPQKAEIKIHEKLGIGLKFYDMEELKKQTSFVYDAIDSTIKDEEFAEIERLLYVALTRAKEYLYIYGTTSSLEYSHFSGQHDIKLSKTYLDLIMKTIDNDDLQKLITNKEIEISKEKVNLAIKIFKEEKSQEDKEENMVIFSKGDSDTKTKFIQSMSYVYPYKEVFKIALKNSVSSLLEEDEFASMNFAPKKLLTSEHLSGENDMSLIGTIYHKILQQIDFDNYNDETIKQIILSLEVQTNQNLFQIIDIEKIKTTIEIVKRLTHNQPLQKEKKFIMQVPYSSVADSKLEDEILVQGIIDVFSIGKENILIDYKLTSLNNDEKIINKYYKQISLYKMALKLKFNLDNIICYIIDINRQKEIKINN